VELVRISILDCRVLQMVATEEEITNPSVVECTGPHHTGLKTEYFISEKVEK